MASKSVERFKHGAQNVTDDSQRGGEGRGREEEGSGREGDGRELDVTVNAWLELPFGL